MNHVQNAESLFLSGYNCAQALFLAYKDELDLDERAMLRMSVSLGGGMGGMREICGAVSAMFLVMGLVCGPDDPTDAASKARHYALLQQMASAFERENGALRCGDLLKALRSGAGSAGGAGSAPADRARAYYAARPCVKLVRCAARLIDERLAAGDGDGRA